MLCVTNHRTKSLCSRWDRKGIRWLKTFVPGLSLGDPTGIAHFSRLKPKEVLIKFFSLYLDFTCFSVTLKHQQMKTKRLMTDFNWFLRSYRKSDLQWACSYSEGLSFAKMLHSTTAVPRHVSIDCCYSCNNKQVNDSVAENSEVYVWKFPNSLENKSSVETPLLRMAAGWPERKNALRALLFKGKHGPRTKSWTVPLS